MYVFRRPHDHRVRHSLRVVLYGSWKAYSKGQYAAMPADDTDLTTDYTSQNYTDVETDNAVRVGQAADDGKFTIHQFKNDVGAESSCTLTCNCQSDLAPSASTVYLQIYNYDTPAWENVDSDSATGADTDFDLTGEIADLTDYKNGTMIACRVYQEN